jgi:electron transport complex protein RnfG
MAPNGFSGEFPVMTGVDILGKIIDTYVLEHKETPGLGSKMTEEGYKSQFKGKKLAGTKWQVKKDGGDIDAITAATISSRAFTASILRALKAEKMLMEGEK